MFDVIPDGWGVVGVGDFNGDSMSDLLLRSDAGAVTDWLGGSDGSFTSNLSVASYALDPSWHVAATGDFNGDSRTDVLLVKTDGTVTEWTGQADGGFARNSLATYSLPTGWNVVGSGDFTGGNQSDILLRHDNGTITDWLGQQDGGFFSNHAIATYGLAIYWQTAGVGDFDGDSEADVLLRNADGGITEWLGQTDGTFVWNAAATYSLDPAWNVAGIGEYNGDNRSDLLLRNDDGTFFDWLGQAGGGFFSNHEASTQLVSNSLQILGVGDFNGDGFSDVLIENSTDGCLQTWLGDESGAILSPTEKLWQDALANVGSFFDALTAQVQSFTSDPANQAGSYDMGDPNGPIGLTFDQFFHSWYSWTGTVQDFSEDSASNFLSFGSNLDFSATTQEWDGFSANFNGNWGSVNLLDSVSSSFAFSINDTFLTGTWHEGAPPSWEADAIVVVGHRPPPTLGEAVVVVGTLGAASGYFSFQAGANGLNFIDGYGGGGPGGVNSGYFSFGVSAAANVFANAHVKNHGASPADEHTYELAHDALANFYDWAAGNLSSLLDIGNGNAISAGAALIAFFKTTIDINPLGGGYSGANTQMSSNYSSAVIQINPEHSNQVGYAAWGDTGIDYVIFHELGHVLNGLSVLYLEDELAANTAGRSMEHALGLSLLPVNVVPYGFD